jgi:hypothetical protein
MRHKTIAQFPNEIEKYYQKLSLYIDTNVLFIHNGCISDYLTIDLPKFYRMLLVEYVTHINQQYVNALIYDMYNVSKTYLMTASKNNIECSFKDWLYYSVKMLISEKNTAIFSLSYPFITHGIFLHNLSDYNDILSPKSTTYDSFLSKSRRDNYQLRDLDYLSHVSLRFIRDIHYFDLLLKRVVAQ